MLRTFKTIPATRCSIPRIELINYTHNKGIMRISLIFGMVFLTLCVEAIASAVGTANQYPFLLRTLLMPGIMLLFCVGLTENFLKKAVMSYSDAGITLPTKSQLPKIIAYACIGAGLWLALLKPYSLGLETVFPFLKKWDLNDSLCKTILNYDGVRLVARHAILIYTLLLLSIAEEFLFRGFLLKYLAKHTSSFKAVFWSSLLFSLVHLNPLAVVLTLPLGLLLGFIMLRTGNIIAPITAHFIFNTALIYIYGNT